MGGGSNAKAAIAFVCAAVSIESGRTDGDIDENESMDEVEAILGLKACVKNILGKQKVEVSTQFADFRSALEKNVFKTNDGEIQTLMISPYFFRKITLGILLNLARTSKGTQLENALANLNVILPLIWPGIRDAEKWLVGNKQLIERSWNEHFA